jgi:hypothetical protein
MAIIIGANPIGVIQNFLPTATNLETYSQAFWGSQYGANGTIVVSASSIAAPDGTMTAQQVLGSTSGANIYGGAYTITSGSATVSVYVATVTGTQTVTLAFYDTTASSVLATQNFTATTTWQRIEVSTAVTSGHAVVLLFYPGGTAGTGTVQGWGFQIEATPYATPYIATTTAPVTVTSNADGTAPLEATASLANPGRKEYSAAIVGGLFSFPENVYAKSVTLVGYEFVLGGQSTWTFAITDGITNASAGDVAIGSGTTETTVVSPDIPGLVLFPGQELRLTTTGTASHNYWRCTVKVAYTLSEGRLWI